MTNRPETRAELRRLYESKRCEDKGQAPLQEGRGQGLRQAPL